jgi:hypothetical protein
VIEVVVNLDTVVNDIEQAHGDELLREALTVHLWASDHRGELFGGNVPVGAVRLAQCERGRIEAEGREPVALRD